MENSDVNKVENDMNDLRKEIENLKNLYGTIVNASTNNYLMIQNIFEHQNKCSDKMQERTRKVLKLVYIALAAVGVIAASILFLHGLH